MKKEQEQEIFERLIIIEQDLKYIKKKLDNRDKWKVRIITFLVSLMIPISCLIYHYGSNISTLQMRLEILDVKVNGILNEKTRLFRNYYQFTNLKENKNEIKGTKKSG